MQLAVQAMHGGLSGMEAGICASGEPTIPMSEFGGETVIE